MDLQAALVKIQSIDPKETRSGWRTGLRDRAILALLAARVSSIEVTKLQGRWIKRSGEGALFVRIPGPPIKVYPIDPRLEEALEKWLDHTGARERPFLLFPGLAPSTVRRIKRSRG